MPIVLCSMSMKAKSNPHAARTRPMSTVRAWRSAIPSESWPAARRSLTLFTIVGIAVSSPPMRAVSVAERGIESVEPAQQPRPDEIAAAAAWPRRVLDHRVRGVDDVLGHRDQLGAARLRTDLDGA